MNMHLSPQDPEVRAQLERDIAEANRPARRKAWTVGLAVAVGVAAFIAFLFWRAGAPKPVAAPPGPPAVSVLVPGTTEVADRVAALGTIQARRDMPVGVAGEGGMITSIRAEAGQYVARGQLLAEIDSDVQRAQLAQLQAGVVQAEADARLAQAELDRALALVDRGFISKADIDRRTATRDSNRARVGVARAQVREMQERINRLSIRAPEAGLVLQRMVEPGQIVSPGGNALFRVAAGGQLELRAQVAEQDMPALAVGQTATVTPVGSRNSYAGTVWLLEPLIDAQTRQGTARIALPRVDEFRSGGFANVVIEGVRARRPLVPQSALQSDRTGSYVLVVGADNVVKRADVQVGMVSADGIAITAGLSGTEKVVVSAAAFLRPGETVKPMLRASAKPMLPASATTMLPASATSGPAAAPAAG